MSLTTLSHLSIKWVREQPGSRVFSARSGPHDIVGNRIVRKAFGSLLRDRTRLLVLNQLQYLPLCDRVIVMKKGRIVGTAVLSG